MSQRNFESCRIDRTEIELSCCSQVVVVVAVAAEAQSWLPAWYKYQEENTNVIVIVVFVNDVVVAFLVVMLDD